MELPFEVFYLLWRIVSIHALFLELECGGGGVLEYTWLSRSVTPLYAFAFSDYFILYW
jgi:hypothetical protein